MENKIKQLLINSILITGMVCSLSSLPALAMTKEDECGPCHPNLMYWNFTKDLSLTSDQKNQIDNIKSEYRSKLKPLKESMMDKKMALHKYILSPNSNQDEALRQSKEISAVRDQLEEMHLNKDYKIKGVLTKEQIDKAKTLHDKRMKNCECERRDKMAE